MKSKMYSVAIRRRDNNTDHFWKHTDYEFIDCRIDTIGGRYWYADPFLFEKDGKTYIFFEAFDMVRRRGKEGYCILREDGTCSLPKFVIDEPFHLSFPNIFEEKGKVYIMPEMCGDYTLKLYKAISFPDKWEVERTLLPDTYACDSVFLEKDGGRYLLTNEMFHNVPNGQYASCYVKNYLYKMDGLNVVDHGCWISEGDYGIRNAGKSFEENGIIYRVGQDCRNKAYGKGMVLFELSSLNPYNEKEIESWSCQEISKHIKTKETYDIIGVHTYNFSEHFEIIDFAGYKTVSSKVALLMKGNDFKVFCKRAINFVKRIL